ncbi:SRPBCC family protein [Streptomyces sp. SS7]|uniref:SRPBCC family protein n=1 Tax=Streptomyces sp. SS7 TaxID=3108485 RepID=UPI0030EEB944
MSSQTDNSVLIDAPLDLVWDMTNDVRSWPNLFTEYAAIEVLHEEGSTVRFRLTMVPDPDGSVWSWVSERTSDRASRTVHAHRIETGPFEYMKINWEYSQEGDGVRMRWQQDFERKPDAPFTIEAITKRINENTLIQMAAIKSKIEAAAGKVNA